MYAKVIWSIAMVVAVILGYSQLGILNDLTIYDSADWWSPDSPFRVLHKMNTVRVPFFQKEIQIGGNVADLGCGGGFVTESIARLMPEARVRGIDISQSSVTQASLHGDSLPNLSYQVGSIYSIPLPSEWADTVIVSDMFEHLEDLDLALLEVFRILKPHGTLVFDTIAKTWWSWLTIYFLGQQVFPLVVAGAHDWRLFISPPDLQAKLVRAGFVADLSQWRGIEPVLSVANAIRNRNLFEFIHGFYQAAEGAELSASYMGKAIKP
jgi:2-polyprenyl-6-hydroxyphenyl methylase/3-demethylubiquinone-9 3-methyltransferase